MKELWRCFNAKRKRVETNRRRACEAALRGDCRRGNVNLGEVPAEPPCACCRLLNRPATIFHLQTTGSFLLFSPLRPLLIRQCLRRALARCCCIRASLSLFSLTHNGRALFDNRRVQSDLWRHRDSSLRKPQENQGRDRLKCRIGQS